jgi:hypothetical protein
VAPDKLIPLNSLITSFTEIFHLKFFMCVWLAFMLMLTIFHHCKAKNFCLPSFLARKKMRLAISQATFFCQCKKARQTKSFCFRMMKNCQHQHKGQPHTQEKSQDAATSMEDAIADKVHPNGSET